MATNAKPAFGVLLQMSDANGANHATIAEVKNVTFNLQSRTEDATAHSSGVPWEVIVPTILSNGVEFEVNWVPNNSTQNSTTGIVYVFMQRQSRNYKIVDPDLGTLCTFDAFVGGFNAGYPVAGLKNSKVTLKGSGAPTMSI